MSSDTSSNTQPQLNETSIENGSLADFFNVLGSMTKEERYTASRPASKSHADTPRRELAEWASYAHDEDLPWANHDSRVRYAWALTLALVNESTVQCGSMGKNGGCQPFNHRYGHNPKSTCDTILHLMNVVDSLYDCKTCTDILKESRPECATLGESKRFHDSMANSFSVKDAEITAAEQAGVDSWETLLKNEDESFGLDFLDFMAILPSLNYAELKRLAELATTKRWTAKDYPRLGILSTKIEHDNLGVGSDDLNLHTKAVKSTLYFAEQESFRFHRSNCFDDDCLHGVARKDIRELQREAVLGLGCETCKDVMKKDHPQVFEAVYNPEAEAAEMLERFERLRLARQDATGDEEGGSSQG